MPVSTVVGVILLLPVGAVVGTVILLLPVGVVGVLLILPRLLVLLLVFTMNFCLPYYR